MPTAEFKIYQEKKHSRRYRTEDGDFPLGDVYVKRPWADGKDTIVIQIEEDE